MIANKTKSPAGKSVEGDIADAESLLKVTGAKTGPNLGDVELGDILHPTTPLDSLGASITDVNHPTVGCPTAHRPDDLRRRPTGSKSESAAGAETMEATIFRRGCARVD